MDVEQALAFTDALVFAKAGVHLSDLQQAMLRESWSWQRQSYDQIAETYGYSPTYLKHDVGPKLWKLLSEVIGEKVNKTSFRAAIERKSLADRSSTQPQTIKPEQLHISQPVAAEGVLEKSADDSTSKPPVLSQVSDLTSRQDWGDAADVSFFYGRAAELTRLEQWIVGSPSQRSCRLVAVLGMGGMGKTSLVIRLAQQLQTQFEWVIWRSLRNALPPAELLSDLLQLLTNQQQVEQSIEKQIAQFLHQLRSHRCLIIFDNIETILHYAQELETSSSDSRQDYRIYRELFRQIGETRHQSCLVLTSREKPPEVALLEGDTLPVRSLTLGGLQLAEAQELMSLKGCFKGTDSEWNHLIAGYSGNPLALKIISTTIQTLFDGNLSEFLQQDTFVFGGIRTLIDQQFQRLSVLEKSVMYWLAIYREPATFADLRADIFPAISPQRLIEVLELLEQRSLIEKQAALFSLQPVVMEYVSDRLITQICTEIQQGIPGITSKDALLKHHALLKAQSKDYIRETQIRLILTPILEQLDPLHDAVDDHLIQQLTCLRGKSTAESGYAGGNLLNLLGQRKTYLSGYDFSHLTLWQADLRQMQLHNINFAQADLSRSIFTEILGIVFAIALSPAGNVLATGDAEGGLRLWQVNQGSLLLTLEGHQGWVWAISFSTDGQIASCSSDKTIRLWSTQTGECLTTLRGHSGSIWSVAFSRDGQLLASGGDEPIVMVWDIAQASCVKQLVGHTGRILSVAFRPVTSGKSAALLLASGSEDGSIRLWNVHKGECQRIYQEHTDRVWSVSFSPNGEFLVSGSADRTLKLWQVKTGKCLKTFSEHGDRVRSVSFSADGQTLISSSDDRTVRIWSVDSGQCLQTLWGHTNSIFSIACHSESQLLVSGSADQTVRIWHSQTGQCLKTLRGYTNSIFSVAYSATGDRLISSSTDQTIKLWDTNTGQCLKTFEGHRGWVTSAAFHPQAHLIASSSADETLKLWEVGSGQCLKTLQGHSHWVQSVSFSPDGAVLASGGDDCTLRLWSVQTGECLHTLAAHSGWVWSVIFSPTGELLASSSEDQTICLWSVPDLQCVHRLQDHSGRVKAIAFSPDGQLLASGSSDETVRLWSVHTGECLHTLRGHDNDVWSVAFSPDGQTLASRSLDQTVKLWEVSTGVCRKTLSVPSRSVRSAIAFSPIPSPSKDLPQNRLAIGSHSGTIQVWNIETGECLSTLTPNRPYDGTNIQGVTGITDAQRVALYALGAIER